MRTTASITLNAMWHVYETLFVQDENYAPIPYLTATAASIMPKEVIDEAGDGDVKRLIGTGPFEFVEYEPDRHLKLKKFAAYSALPGEANGYGGNKVAYVDEIVFIPVPDTAVRIAGVQTGDYHFGEWITPDEYDRLQTISGIQTRVIKPSGWTTAVFNKQKGLMSNKLMRQAVLAALDMGPIMKAAYGHDDFWRLDSGVLFQEQALYSDAGKEFYNQINPDRARQLAQQAGYNGQPIRWVTTTEYPAYYNTALVAKSQLEKAGFVVDLQVVDWATVVEKRADPDAYDVFSTAFGTSWDPALFLGFGATWPGWYVSAENDALVAALRRESNPTKRQVIWDELQALFWEDVPVLKFGDYFLLHIHRNQIKGYAARATTFYWNVWIEK